MANDSESKTQSIPIQIRKADPSLPIPSSYSTTPHGTIFSTTPGGTRIIYDRKELLNLRNSPLSRTPPVALAFVPGITKGFSPANANSQESHTQTSANSQGAATQLNSDSQAAKTNGTLESDHGDKHKRETGEMFHMELE
ncbi:hypothetical protein DSO57_1009894 [Entomophthora muscae]|uniref:Uncharacterized protein n=2 Tax=Entomophthora muscae TaxID=34485 RepID=A0ACC2RSC7_9FUNG|nr:hypothetical protein DSO57_1028677 [Entomophthora muscae]KAJ9070285.1 hypothetical protein DSO57_1009894 [Entomophthora muscae]